jgi:hypothetical protein
VRPPATVGTTAVARIWPGRAAATRRAASTTGVPKTSSSSKLTSPKARPTRMTSGTPARRACPSTACYIAMAQATASAAAPKMASTPSPSVFTCFPPVRSMA